MVIATVFLTIIGMSAGLALASWHKSNAKDNQSQNTTPQTYVPSPTTGAEPLCPEQTQQIAVTKGGAAGQLRQLMRVETDRQTVVWICEDADGKLFYQANRGGENAEWVEGRTALFLSGVTRQGDDSYLAKAADGNSFSIDRKRLLITFARGGQQTQPVVSD